MNRPPLRLARPGQLPAPRHRRRQPPRPHRSDRRPRPPPHAPTGSATPPSTCTPWPASSPTPSSSCPRPSTTPATRNSPGPRSASSWAPPPPPRHAATGTTHDQLDKDHPHNAAVGARRSRVTACGKAPRDVTRRVVTAGAEAEPSASLTEQRRRVGRGAGVFGSAASCPAPGGSRYCGIRGGGQGPLSDFLDDDLAGFAGAGLVGRLGDCDCDQIGVGILPESAQ